MSLDMEEYKEAFFEEAKEHIETLTQALLVLEKDPKNTESLNNIFRSAHTLKGSSGMMGFKDLQDLAHAMEDVFDGLRKGGEVSSEMIDVLLECIDALALRLDGIQNGSKEKIATAQFVERLHEFFKKSLGTAKKSGAKKEKNQSQKKLIILNFVKKTKK